MADESFKQEFLDTQNQYRAQHQVPALTYSEDLCGTAQKWAEHMLSNKSLVHGNISDGENVFYAFSSQKKAPTGKEAANSWKSSTELGVGMATDGNTVFVVGQYRPAGNITNAGYYEENVLPKDK
ncbi:hypothetical protein ABG768_006976 [Culter alburnus]|uniref:SCP domain-containing protein n=1 Tax=Culter alburnus TaxID=194366 RepID=A0AAW1ZU09_CULAL